MANRRTDTKMRRVLIIAGSDSGGGAGIQADVKTAAAHAVFAMTAVTAVTIQDTEKVHSVVPVPVNEITRQIEVVMQDIGADAIKIGMLGSVDAGRAILDALSPYEDIPWVVDPVLVATSGDVLGDQGVLQMLRSEFLPRARVMTPNMPEMAALTGEPVETVGQLGDAARALIEMGARGVLAKAGHLPDDPVTDVYYEGDKGWTYSHPKLSSTSTHGTGCTLATAIACGLAEGLEPHIACRHAVDYVTAAITHAPGFGHGHGPLNHSLCLDAEHRWVPMAKLVPEKD